MGLIPRALCTVMLAFGWPFAALASDMTVDAKPIALNPDNPSQTKLANLVWRGGLALRADHRRFGGFSGLEALDNGSLVAVNDFGWRLDLRPVIGDDGDLASVDTLGFARLHDSDGNDIAEKRYADAESLARMPDGRVVIAFERAHRVAALGGRRVSRSLVPPKELMAAPSNGGIEAMTALLDGRILILTEKMRADPDDGGAVVGWVGRSGDWRRIAYPISLGYLPTGAATMSDGSVLVLERHYTPLTGVAARIRHISAATLDEPFLNGPILANLEPPITVDNMEGIAIDRRYGRTFVYLISDDNLNPPQQRTLLMKFEWMTP